MFIDLICSSLPSFVRSVARRSFLRSNSHAEHINMRAAYTSCSIFRADGTQKKEVAVLAIMRGGNGEDELWEQRAKRAVFPANIGWLGSFGLHEIAVLTYIV